MLYLQKGIDPSTNETVWLMLDNDYQIIEPIQRFLTFMTTTKSPNTIKSYGQDLKYWWLFLEKQSLDWREVNVSDLENYAHWLRVGDTKVTSLQPVEAIRSEKTVNRMITGVTQFYEYHIANKTVDLKQFHRFHLPYGITNRSSRGLLTGIAKTKPVRQKLVKLKEKKKFSGCLTDEQVEVLVNSCNRLRDKLIILMLNATGMRKGELLGLKHEDISDFGENYIKVVKRKDNPNGARAKGQERTIPVIPELIQMYNDYLLYEYPEVHSEYVFINIWEGDVGKPINPDVLSVMMKRLSEKTRIKVHAHLFRHTYATRLLKAGYAPDRVKYLLGHASINTTLDVYSHVIEEVDLWGVIKQEEEE